MKKQDKEWVKQTLGEFKEDVKEDFLKSKFENEKNMKRSIRSISNEIDEKQIDIIRQMNSIKSEWCELHRRISSLERVEMKKNDPLEYVENSIRQIREEGYTDNSYELLEEVIEVLQRIKGK